MQDLGNMALNAGSQLASKLIGGTGLSEGAKQALEGVKDRAVGYVGNMIGKQGGSGNKPDVPGSTGEKPAQLSGWDKFKNFWAGLWNKTGGALTGKMAHEVKPEDYNSKAADAEKNGFSWSTANKNYEQEHGKKRGDWDVGKMIATGAKVATMI